MTNGRMTYAIFVLKIALIVAVQLAAFFWFWWYA